MTEQNQISLPDEVLNTIATGGFDGVLALVSAQSADLNPTAGCDLAGRVAHSVPELVPIPLGDSFGSFLKKSGHGVFFIDPFPPHPRHPPGAFSFESIRSERRWRMQCGQ